MVGGGWEEFETRVADRQRPLLGPSLSQATFVLARHPDAKCGRVSKNFWQHSELLQTDNEHKIKLNKKMKIKIKIKRTTMSRKINTFL